MSVPNFADDNILPSFDKTVNHLESILKLANGCVMGLKILVWLLTLTNSKQFYLIKKNSGLYLNGNITIDKENIKVVSNVKMLDVHNDRTLNFNLHIDIVFKSTLNQLNALVRLKRDLGPDERFVLVNSFIYPNFNYCPLAWMFSSKRSLIKLNICKKEPFAVLDNYTSKYELLLEKSGKPTMKLA